MTRYKFLLTVTAFNAVMAILGGIGLVTGIIAPPDKYIDGTVFNSYVIPGLILLFVVGGTSAYASLRLFSREKYARDMAAFAGLVMMGWIIGEIAIIDTLSWLQILFFLTGFVAFEAAYPGSPEFKNLLKKKHILRSA